MDDDSLLSNLGWYLLMGLLVTLFNRSSTTAAALADVDERVATLEGKPSA